MTIYQAIHVHVLADYDHGEGWMSFEWPDKLYGTEGLSIDFNGHCSRDMPIRSGSGHYELDLQRDSILIRFESQLAKKLELDELIKIEFTLDDDHYRELRQFVDGPED